MNTWEGMVRMGGRRIARREFLGGLAAAGVVAACGGSSSSQSSNRLTVLNTSIEAGTPLLDRVHAFQKSAKVDIALQPAPSGTAYETKLRTVFASGSPPDIVELNDDLVGYWWRQGELTDLRDYLKKDKIDPKKYVKTSFTYPIQPDGTHAAWVIGSEPTLIFYNVDAFTQAGLPMPPTEWNSPGWTLNDFVTAAQKLTDQGKRWGALVYDDTGAESIYPVEYGTPGGIYTKDSKKFLLGTQQGAAAMQWLADLTCKYHAQPPWGQLQARTNINFDNDFFVSGKVAMIERHLSTAAYFASNVKDFHWDVAPSPSNKGRVAKNAFTVFAISKQSKNKDLAWRFLSSLTSSESQRYFATKRYLVPLELAAASELKSNGTPPEHINLFVQAAEHGVMENTGDYINRARTLYRPVLDQVFGCDARADGALQGITPDVNRALDGKY